MAKDYDGKNLNVGDYLGWFNFGSGGNHGTITKIIDDNHVEVKDVDGHVYPISLTAEKYVLANSRACNSSNPVVRNAMAANRRMAKNAVFDDGSVLVSYKGFGSPTETQKRMTSRDFKTWLEKNGLGDKAQEIWFALMKGDDCAFMTGGTKVKVKAL